MMVVSDFSKVAQMLDGGAETETPLVCLLKRFQHNAAWKESQRKYGTRMEGGGEGREE